MMKDVDGLSRHINKIIHRYLVHTYYMRATDIVQRPLFYCYDIFTNFSNSRRVTIYDKTKVKKSSSLFPPLSIVHQFPINFTSTPSIQSYSTLSLKPPIFYHIVPPEDILWFPFDSKITSLGSLLSRWTGGFANNYIFKIDV